MGGLKPTFYVCFCCGGDGKETCTNPDHGFISMMGGDAGRLGCPVCGHDPEHKVIDGGDCEVCEGEGIVESESWYYQAEKYRYDEDPVEYEGFVYMPSEKIEKLEERLDLMIDNLRIHNRINGAKLLNNGFISGEFLNISPGLKKLAKQKLSEEIDDAVLKERIYEFGNDYQILLIEGRYLN